MFKVTERYDLKTLWDILPAEQKQQQQQTHQQEDQQQGQEEEQGQKQEQKERRNTDARKTRKLSIVGREGEQTGSLGLLLCVQIGGKTYLDLFRPKTLEVTPLATWNKDVNVVWASVNPCMSMVAVSYERATMVEKRQGPVSIRVPERSYDTFVQALRYPGTDKDHHHYQQRQQQQQQHYSSQHVLYHSTQTPQRADFVSEDIKTPFLSTVTLLLTVFNEGITTYTVGIEKRETSSTQSEYIISKPPKKDISICSQFIWSQYTQGTGVLYYITSKQQKGKGKPLHEFHTVPMHTKKPLKNATERVIPALFNMSSYFSLNPVYGTYPLPYTICPIEGEAEENGGFGESTMVTSPLPNVSVVELSPAVVCICVQFEFITHKDGAVSIPVSVIPLTVHARIDFAIPLPGKRGEDFNENTRVSFDACNDFLAVYIPGVYAQLFDFSETHDPFLGLSAETHENATQLGGANAVAPLGDSILLSIKSSVMYMYEISKDFLLEACNTSKNPVVRAKALHAACVHLNDSELASEMLHSALAKGTADVEFIKEVIVGNTFNSLRNSIPYPILLGYPSTALQYTSLVVNKQTNKQTNKQQNK